MTTERPSTVDIVFTWRFIGANAVVWTALALLFAVQGNLSMRVPIPMYQSIGYALAAFLPCFLLTPFIVMLALRHRLVGAARPAVVAHLLGLVAFVVVGGAMMGTFEWMLPWANHAVPVPAAAGRAIVRYLASDVLIYTMVVAAVQAAAYGHEARRRAMSEVRLNAELAEAKLQVLTAQLQPHFLFNALHAISALVREEPQQAERLLARLSELLRHALQSLQRPDSSLEEEIGFLEKYVALQQARFGDRLSVAFQVDPELHDSRVPALLLQPLVENSIRHGVSRVDAMARIVVTARRELGEDRMRLSVWDNGSGLPAGAPPSDGVGLRTTRARLRQYYGERHAFSLENAPDGGVRCMIVVPRRVRADGA